MTSYLIDTNVLSEFSKPAPVHLVVEWVRRADPSSLFISVISLGEIRLGIEYLDAGRRRNELELWFVSELSAWFAANVLPVTRETADRWGRIATRAKRQGLALKTSDGLIAATALEHGLTLVTRDVRDFVGLDVLLLNPWDK